MMAFCQSKQKDGKQNVQVKKKFIHINNAINLTPQVMHV
jgi:hypothetical protein